jgi:hypothetical protein
MPDFLRLSAEDRLEALNFAAAKSGRAPHLLEKDVWVVWALDVLFRAPFGEHLVFKGGTSLSKAHKIIRRFSEDIDVTFDIRALVPELTESATTNEAIPPNRSQEKRWTSEIRKRLPVQIADQVMPAVRAALATQQLQAELRQEDDKLFIRYQALTAGTGYVRPEILLEFGARSTGEPCDVRPVITDAAEHIPELTFPTASPRTMRPERTFWEKATAAHAYCITGGFRGGNRFARHWHDITQLDAFGMADAALADIALGQTVARHKTSFFPEKGVDYTVAVSGKLQLIPTDGAPDHLEADYEKMLDDRLLPVAESYPFEDLLERCLGVQARANSRATYSSPTPAPPRRRSAGK